MGLTNETLEEPGPGRDHVRNRCPSPNIKQPRASLLVASGQMTARTNPRGGAIGSPSAMEKDGGRDEEDSKPSPLVTSSDALIASYPDQEIVQEEATHQLVCVTLNEAVVKTKRSCVCRVFSNVLRGRVHYTCD
jgi:hypothetical protein